MTDTADWLRLTLISGIGGESQRKLLAEFGSPAGVFSASITALQAIIGHRARLLETETKEAVSAALTWAQEPNQHIVTLADSDYPTALLNIPDPPSLLYVRGRRELLSTIVPAIAVVGSRNATAQGERDAQAFSTLLAGAGLCIVSGLALGIDAAAHRGALNAGGKTIAVIGTGADRLYPARNHELAAEIIAHGAIISEFPLGTHAIASNFPRRNRIISGLSQGVLVIEAATESGSLITARLAGEQGRDVFAIPGSIHSAHSRGCHRLIRQGAKLVETAQDILEELNLGLNGQLSAHPDQGNRAVTDTFSTINVTKHTNSPAPAIACSPEEELLSCAGFDPVTIDELVSRSGLTAEALSVMLLGLELNGLIASLPGGRFQRLTDSYR